MANFFIDSPGPNPKAVSEIQQLLDSDSVHDGDSIVLRGTFSQKPNDFLRLSKSVTLRGDAVDGATISGGKQLEWGRAPGGKAIQPIAATIEHITFEEFTIGAIWIMGARGNNVIRNCRFEHYHFGVKSPALQGAWPIVAGGANVTGALTITGCHFGAPEVLAGGMNNLMHVNNCDLQHLVISNNVIEDMYWMGLAVYGVCGFTEIVGNTITQRSSWGGRAGVGIAFGLRLSGTPMNRDGSVAIERNTINIESADSYGIMVGLYPETNYMPSPATGTARAVTIRDNVVHMNGIDATGKKADRAALACLGACSNANWTNNVVTGAAQFGIWVSQETTFAAPSTGAPSNNSFRENKFAGGLLTDPTDGKATQFEPFTASQAQVCIDHTVSHLDLRDNTFGPVSGSNKSPQHLEAPVRSGIACYGSDSKIVSNDFANSGIQGWIGGPPHVGCIYFGESACRNHVEYSEAEFPPGTLHPTSRQIFDESQPGMKPLPDTNIVPELEAVTN